MLMCALFMIIFGILGKVAAFFANIPMPIVGGLFCVLSGKKKNIFTSLQQFCYFFLRFSFLHLFCESHHGRKILIFDRVLSNT